eukprot:m.34614 g.34614  ORF g.34614 m.34614 type:complete len:73 (+) comp6543_c0_seq1:1222-1440(+)
MLSNTPSSTDAYPKVESLISLNALHFAPNFNFTSFTSSTASIIDHNSQSHSRPNQSTNQLTTVVAIRIMYNK